MNRHLNVPIAVAVWLTAKCVPCLAQLEAEKPPKVNTTKANIVSINTVGPRAERQSDSDIGGSVPTIGCHSVIDNPECVRRVTPPTTIMANTSAQHSNNHAATARGALPVATSDESVMAGILPHAPRSD